MMAASEIASGLEETLKRKERLKVLRSKRSGNQEDSESTNKDVESSMEAKKPILKFRSYNPQTESLKESKLPKAKPTDVEPHIQESVEAARNADVGDVNLANLAPRKVDWDLKRDINKKLEKLERKTQRAIVELIQARLGEETGDDVDLAAAVATAGKEQSYDSD